MAFYCYSSNVEEFIYELISENSAFQILSNAIWTDPICVAATVSLHAKNMKFSGLPDKYARTMIKSLQYSKNLTDFPSTYIPPIIIESNKDINAVAKAIVSKFRLDNIENSSELVEVITHLLTEIMDNAFTHSNTVHSPVVMAQYFPEKEKIQVVIADSGEGFSNSLKDKYPEIGNDSDALKLSLKLGVTGVMKSIYSTGRGSHRGRELALLNTILEKCSGKLTMVSRKGILKKDYYNDTINSKDYERDWPGSIVCFDLQPKYVNLSILQYLGYLKDEVGLIEETF